MISDIDNNMVIIIDSESHTILQKEMVKICKKLTCGEYPEMFSVNEMFAYYPQTAKLMKVLGAI